MAEAGSLFQDWYNTYVRSRVKKDLPADQYGTPGSLTASPTPTPSAPVASPAMDPVDAESAALDAAAGDQDGGWSGPTPVPPTATPSLTDRFKSGLSRVGEGLKDPASMGLLTAGLSMMATPPRQAPYSNAEILGNAGLTGVKYYEQALEAKRKDELMKQTAEEHTLAREDRRTANLDRAEYYKGSLANRDAALEEKKKDNESIGENTFGIDPKTPMWKAKALIPLVKQENAPGKEAKLPDRYQNWRETFKAERGRYPNAKEEEHFGKTESGGADGPGKSAAITHINREMVSQYLERAQAGITAKGAPGSAETKAMLDALNSQDPLTGGPNESKVYGALNAEEKKEYNFVKRRAQVLSNTMVPAEAVAQAQREYAAKNPAKAPPVKPGVTVKKLRMRDGTVQEFDAAGNRVK